MQPERKRERLGSSFFALSRREHKAESNGAATESIGSALSNERTTEREKEEEEWRTWREERRGKTPLGDHFQHLVSTPERARLSRSRFRSCRSRPLRCDATAELFKNSTAAATVGREFGKA